MTSKSFPIVGNYRYDLSHPIRQAADDHSSSRYAGDIDDVSFRVDEVRHQQPREVVYGAHVYVEHPVKGLHVCPEETRAGANTGIVHQDVQSERFQKIYKNCVSTSSKRSVMVIRLFL